MKNFWFDTETFSRVPIKNGTHAYAQSAEVMLWSYAQDDGPIYVWDRTNGTLNWKDELSDCWYSQPLTEGVFPPNLLTALKDEENLVWGHNSGMFDFVVLHHAMPEVLALVPMERRRDTMIQAFSHSMPGSLDKLGGALSISEDKLKLKTGRALVMLFCKPQNEAFVAKYGTDRATKQTHPAEWQQFIEYAGGDIETMREVHRKLPKWNYTGKQVDLWHVDMKINNRGFLIDVDLANNAIRAVDAAKARFAKRTQEITDGEVQAATQRDAMLKYILEAHGVELPDMQADTLERRLQDDNLPEIVKELIKLRLVASMNSTAKYKTALKGVSSDGRLRGCAQFRGAGRTGRYAHRMFQFGNLPRPTLTQEMIAAGILVAGSDDGLDLVIGDLVMQWASSAIRGVIIAPKGKKLAVADLANIEGRAAAWLAGEDWKVQAFRDYDAGVGPDLYILAYAKSFNVPTESVPKKGPQRQIGKVEELMFQYGGGVGAWITGAATYGIDLDKMTDQVYPVLPQWAIDEAMSFVSWLYESAEKRHAKTMKKIDGMHSIGGGTLADLVEAADKELEAARLKARHGLSYRTFIACDAIKRLWRKAHPAISSYWKELEETVRAAVNTPGVTLTARKIKVRRDGAWLRLGLPSGRALCYPNPAIEKDGSISFTGTNTYTRKWEKVFTYGGKLFENCIAEGTEVLTEHGWTAIEAVGLSRVWDGEEWVTHGGWVYRGKQHTIDVSGVRMTPDHLVLTTEGWVNASSCEGYRRATCRVPDSYQVPRQQRVEVSVGGAMRLRCHGDSARVRAEEVGSPWHHGVLRVSTQSHSSREENNTRHVHAPGVLGVAQHGRQVQPADEQGVAQLRGPRDNCLRRVARFLRHLLGGHGAEILPGTDAGEGEQQQRLLPGELRVGHEQAAVQQPQRQRDSGHPRGEDVRGGCSGHLRSEEDDVALQAQRGLAPTESSRAVYDLINCGPRRRFMVRNRAGEPLIVHNCVQAVAADQFIECFPLIEDAGFEIVVHVHDEVVAEVPADREGAADKLGRLMCSDLGWNEGLPLSAAGFETDRYRKDD